MLKCGHSVDSRGWQHQPYVLRVTLDSLDIQEETIQKMELSKKGLRSMHTTVERVIAIGVDTKGAAREVAEVGKGDFSQGH